MSSSTTTSTRELANLVCVWGKTRGGGRGSATGDGKIALGHLMDHLMAVVAVTRALLDLPRFAMAARAMLTAPPGCAGRGDEPLTQVEALPFLWAAAVHDIGKLTFPFQAKQARMMWPGAKNSNGRMFPSGLSPSTSDEGICALARLWCWLDGQAGRRGCAVNPGEDIISLDSKVRWLKSDEGRHFFHGEAGKDAMRIIDKRLGDMADDDAWLWRHLARAAFAHHGRRLPEDGEQRGIERHASTLWGGWDGWVAEFWLLRMEALAMLSLPGDNWGGFKSVAMCSYGTPHGMHALAHWAAGLVTLADWLGSGLVEPGDWCPHDTEALRVLGTPGEYGGLFDAGHEFANIKCQNRRWLDATETVPSAARDSARAALTGEWRALLDLAQDRVRGLFHDEIALCLHRSAIEPWTGTPLGSATEGKPWRTALRPLQVAVDSMNVAQMAAGGGHIVIMEAPTGSGKTEAAQILTSRLIRAGVANGAVFALPTEASATRLNDRFGQYASGLFRAAGIERPAVVASQQASGSAAWLRRQGERQFADCPGDNGGPADDREADNSGNRSCLAARKFFTAHNRRSFLAPFTTCTVDQVEMAAMPGHHAQVRALGMAGRVLIIDEAHAYDGYMRDILMEAIKMHARMGGWTIVLSATLPQHIREQMLDTYLARSDLTDGALALPAPGPHGYPLITHAPLDGGACDVKYVTVSSAGHAGSAPTQVDIEWAVHQNGAWHQRFPVAWRALTQVAAGPDGGCVAIICNTVKQARKVYLEISAWAAAQGGECPVETTLLHSQFRRVERQAIEKSIFSWAGPEPSGADHRQLRRGRIVVATQVVEQSLDFDFDLMITDVAPIDLLIQRAGRLHRHGRGWRPAAARTPIMHVLIEHRPSDPADIGRELGGATEGTALRRQCRPYLPDLGRGVDCEIMINTIAHIATLSANGGVHISPQTVRGHVASVYNGATRADMAGAMIAGASRITMEETLTPLLTRRLHSTGVPADVDHRLETRSGERDTIDLLLLARGSDGKYSTPGSIVGPSSVQPFYSLLRKSGSVGDKFDRALLDNLQGWIVPVPSYLCSMDDDMGGGVVDADLFNLMTGHTGAVDAKRGHDIPFQVVEVHAINGAESEAQRFAMTLGGGAPTHFYDTKLGFMDIRDSQPS